MTFARRVKAKLTSPFNDLIGLNRPKEKELTVVFAVISELGSEKTLYLPFFSRVDLNKTCKILKGLGFNVQLLKIDVDSFYAKTKKCPSKA